MTRPDPFRAPLAGFLLAALVGLVLAPRNADGQQVRSQTLEDGGVLISLGGRTQPASAAGKPQTTTSSARPISLDLQQADIHSVLRLFAEVSDMNFVVDDSVQGKVSIYMTDVPWDTALLVILQSKGLTAVSMGHNIQMVQPTVPTR
ncbi:MAG: hypothetical protein QGG40_03185 [Myxococcota bacterium]|nr:hypothetical protein [Myxococcota bacterium]